MAGVEMVTKKNKFWTDEKVAELRRLCAAGAIYTEIAAALGTTRSAVGGKISALKLASRKHTPSARVRRKQAAVPAPRRRAVVVRRPVLPQPLVRLLPEPVPLGVSIFGLDSRACRWPYGERHPYTFCGHDTHGEVYCPHHAQRADKSLEKWLGGSPGGHQESAAAPGHTPT